MGPPAPSRPAFQAILDLCRAVGSGSGRFRTLRVQAHETRGRLHRFPKCESQILPADGMGKAQRRDGSGRGELKVPAESAIRHTQVIRTLLPPSVRRRNLVELADRIRTPFTPNQDLKITTLEPDYLNFSTMQGDKQLSCKHFATSALRVNYARERRIVCALQAAPELTREEPDYYRLARIWRTSLAQSEVVRSETAAVASPRRPPSKPEFRVSLTRRKR